MWNKNCGRCSIFRFWPSCIKHQIREIVYFISFFDQNVMFFFGLFFWLMNDEMGVTKHFPWFLGFAIFKFYVLVHEFFSQMKYEIELIWMKLHFWDFFILFYKFFLSLVLIKFMMNEVFEKLCETYSIKLFKYFIFAIFSINVILKIIIYIQFPWFQLMWVWNF